MDDRAAKHSRRRSYSDNLAQRPGRRSKRTRQSVNVDQDETPAKARVQDEDARVNAVFDELGRGLSPTEPQQQQQPPQKPQPVRQRVTVSDGDSADEDGGDVRAVNRQGGRARRGSGLGDNDDDDDNVDVDEAQGIVEAEAGRHKSLLSVRQRVWSRWFRLYFLLSLVVVAFFLSALFTDRMLHLASENGISYTRQDLGLAYSCLTRTSISTGIVLEQECGWKLPTDVYFILSFGLVVAAAALAIFQVIDALVWVLVTYYPKLNCLGGGTSHMYGITSALLATASMFVYPGGFGSLEQQFNGAPGGSYKLPTHWNLSYSFALLVMGTFVSLFICVLFLGDPRRRHHRSALQRLEQRRREVMRASMARRERRRAHNDIEREERHRRRQERENRREQERSAQQHAIASGRISDLSVADETAALTGARRSSAVISAGGGGGGGGGGGARAGGGRKGRRTSRDEQAQAALVRATSIPTHQAKEDRRKNRDDVDDDNQDDTGSAVLDDLTAISSLQQHSRAANPAHHRAVYERTDEVSIELSDLSGDAARSSSSNYQNSNRNKGFALALDAPVSASNDAATQYTDSRMSDETASRLGLSPVYRDMSSPLDADDMDVVVLNDDDDGAPIRHFLYDDNSNDVLVSTSGHHAMVASLRAEGRRGKRAPSADDSLERARNHTEFMMQRHDHVSSSAASDSASSPTKAQPQQQRRRFSQPAHQQSQAPPPCSFDAGSIIAEAAAEIVAEPKTRPVEPKRRARGVRPGRVRKLSLEVGSRARWPHAVDDDDDEDDDDELFTSRRVRQAVAGARNAAGARLNAGGGGSGHSQYHHHSQKDKSAGASHGSRPRRLSLDNAPQARSSRSRSKERERSGSVGDQHHYQQSQPPVSATLTSTGSHGEEEYSRKHIADILRLFSSDLQSSSSVTPGGSGGGASRRTRHDHRTPPAMSSASPPEVKPIFVISNTVKDPLTDEVTTTTHVTTSLRAAPMLMSGGVSLATSERASASDASRRSSGDNTSLQRPKQFVEHPAATAATAAAATTPATASAQLSASRAMDARSRFLQQSNTSSGGRSSRAGARVSTTLPRHPGYPAPARPSDDPQQQQQQQQQQQHRVRATSVTSESSSSRARHASANHRTSDALWARMNGDELLPRDRASSESSYKGRKRR